jgi:hypothetical protein
MAEAGAAWRPCAKNPRGGGWVRTFAIVATLFNLGAMILNLVAGSTAMAVVNAACVGACAVMAAEMIRGGMR